VSELPPLSDAQLMADLDEIEAQSKARKRSGESWAFWTMTAQLDAITRFHLRAGYACGSIKDALQLAPGSPGSTRRTTD
jgi:hypothetical protein